MHKPLLTILVCLTVAFAAADATAKSKKGRKGKNKTPAAAAPAEPAGDKAAGGDAGGSVTAPEGFEDIKADSANCKKDIDSACLGVPEGKGRIAHCLRKNKSRISADCAQALNAFIKQRFLSVCKKDMTKHCKKESTQKGKLMPCMAANKDKLADECQMVMGFKAPPPPEPAPAPAKK